jgi:hypothetical protein
MSITTADNDIKERLSVAYVVAVAPRAGCQVAEVLVDRNQIDVTISSIRGARVKIDAQLKSTSAAVINDPMRHLVEGVRQSRSLRFKDD